MLMLTTMSGFAPASAIEVYPGCAEPPTSPTGQIWIFDAVNGSDQGDGSPAKPWKTLQALTSPIVGSSPLLSNFPYRRAADGTIASNPDAPIRPGDTIRLMTGAYGSLTVAAPAHTLPSAKFITLEAAPGQAPLMQTLTFQGATKWYVRNIKLQALADGWSPLIRISDSGDANSADIVLDHLSMSSQDDVRGWSQEDWKAKARMAGVKIGGGNPDNTICTSVLNSAMDNMRGGAFLFGSKILFADNSINYFTGDGLDYAGNDLTITRNTITNNLNVNDGVHPDAMQGQIGYVPPGRTSNTFNNIMIDRNLVIRQTDPKLPFPSYLQGIDAFNMDWSHLTVSNNVIITSACQGVGYASVHDGLIVNNTVLDDGSDIGTRNAAGAIMCRPWIMVYGQTHEGSPSNDVIVRNNIATSFWIANTLSGVVADHNLCTRVRGSCSASFYKGQRLVRYTAPGVYGDRSTVTDLVIDRNGPASQFVDFDPLKLRFDVRLRAGASAIGFGNPDLAPPIDFAGAPRIPPIDAGAYVHAKNQR